MRFGPRSRVLLLPLFLAWLCTSTAAVAALITVEFSGTIDFIDDADGVTDGSVAEGVPFTGTATWDDAATDSAPGDPIFGNYHGSAPPWNLVLDVGSYAFAPGTGLGVRATVANFPANRPEVDVFRVEAQAATVNGAPSTSSLTAGPSFVLRSDGNAVLTSDALTGVPLSPSAWDFVGVEVFMIAEEGFAFFSGSIDQYAIPEPATAAALSLGLALLGTRRVSSRLRRG